MEILILAAFKAGSYTLVAVGFALVFGSCRVLNLMHGTYVMLGAYATHALIRVQQGIASQEPSSVVVASAVLTAAAATAVVGYGFFKLLQFTNRTHPYQVLAISLTGNLFIAQALQYLYGTDGLNVIPILEGRTSILGVTVPRNDLIIPLVAVVTVVVLWFWLHQSRSGIALRAVADHPEAARLLGIAPDQALTGAVGIAAFVAGLAGGITAPSLSLAPSMWIHPLLVSFAVVVFGGRGSLIGAVASASLIGFVETTTSWYLGEAVAQYTTLIVIIAGLIVLPSGLSGAPPNANR